MQLFLGDEVTIVNGDTWVTGKTRGIILDAHNETERIYIHHIDGCFWMKDGWKFVEETELEDEDLDD
jgi:hypothetical protein